MPEPVRIGTSSRGFGHYAAFTTNHGADVSVHESNSATTDAVWITTHGGTLNPPGGNHGRAHLNEEQAILLRNVLTVAITDVAIDPQPPGHRYTVFVDTYGSTITLRQAWSGDPLHLDIAGVPEKQLGHGLAFLTVEAATQIRDGLTAWLNEQERGTCR